MDITIEVMLPERGGTDYSQPGNAGYDMLGIVAVYDHLKVTDVVGMPRTGYVHVTGIPDAAFKRLKAVLESPWVELGVDDVPLQVAKRLWRGVASLIPANARNRLATNRQITVTWVAFKGFLQNVKEQRAFSDADIA